MRRKKVQRWPKDQRIPFFRSRKRIFLTLAAVAVVAVVVTVPTVLLTNDSSSETPETSPDDIPDGVWTSRGWGYVIDVADGEWTWMEETAISCILVARQPADGDSLSQYFGDILLDDNGDVATFMQDPCMSPIVFDKVDASQGACANGLTLVAGDAGYVRDPLWTLMFLQRRLMSATHPSSFVESTGMD